LVLVEQVDHLAHIHVKEQQVQIQYLVQLHQQVVDKQKVMVDQVVVEVQVLLRE
jgi:hypothetical protein